MDKDAKKASGIGKNGLVTAESPILGNHVDGEVQSGESAALLPSRKGGILRNKEKVCRKVQWNDNNGNKLAEVLVFEPRNLCEYHHVVSWKSRRVILSEQINQMPSPTISDIILQRPVSHCDQTS